MTKDPNKKKKGIIREFGLSSLSVDNQTSVVVLLFIILVMGISSYKNMPKENFPEVNIPTIYVGTPYPGNSPLDIENLITRPLEKEIKTITGIKELTSTSIQDHSTIVVEFGFDVDVQVALSEVKDAVDKANSELPTDLDKEPNVFEMDFSEMPVMNVNLSGEDFSAEDLKYYAEYLQEKFEDVNEISKADIKGAHDKEVKINVDRFKMEAMEISFKDIEDAIGYENRTISGGDLLVDDFRRSIRIIGEFKNTEEIGKIVVKNRDQKIVYLKDFAEISFAYEEPESYSRSYSNDVVTLEIKKRSGENLLIATDKIKEILQKNIDTKLPNNLKVDITNDTSRMTRLQVSNLENSIISGVILVVLVLLFFLGLRNAIFVGIAIPISILLGIFVLHAMDITLNMMVLFSLVLALGMLVDNGIVVVENIYRLMQEGKSPVRAAKEGVGEVAWPIISSTATTLAAFMPLLFWDDIMGEFMQYLPLTLIIVLSSSLFVALVINPVLTSLFMKVQESEEDELKTVKKRKSRRKLLLALALGFVAAIGLYFMKNILFGNILMAVVLLVLLNLYVLTPLSVRFQDVFLPRLERLYHRTITFALDGWKPAFFLIATFLVMIGSMIFYFSKDPNVITFPENIPNYVNIFIEMPTGTDIEKTNALTKKIEKRVFDYLEQYKDETLIESVVSNVGKGTSDPNSGKIERGASPNKSRITVSFVEYQHRTVVPNTQVVLEDLRNLVEDVPGAQITVDKDANGPPLGPPISVEVSGENFDELIALSKDVMQHIEDANIPGIEELKTDLDVGKPELIVDIDRAAARRYGLSTAQIASTIRTALFGKEVSKYKEGEDDFPIMLRLSDKYRYNLEDLINQKITYRNQNNGKIVQVPISAVADVRYSSTYGAVNRKDADRVITIYSNVITGYNPNKIIAQLGEIFMDYKLPDGYTIKYTGEIEEQQKSMDFLTRAFMIALFVIFLILITQFNSITAPLIIMLSVLFSTTGVFLGLGIFNMDFVVIMTGIGIISLAGVVVNNAIVLIDYTDLVRQRRRKELGLNSKRLPKDELVSSIIIAGETRLRPVLLTAITTVLGLIPLAIGFNINFNTLFSNFDPQIFIGGDNVVFWGPMSWTIIFGLTFATFLTLVIVPVMYLTFDFAKYKLGKLFGKV
ncbi:MAG: efflux RND transporter permease subunit [Chitinophagales bacterium]